MAVGVGVAFLHKRQFTQVIEGIGDPPLITQFPVDGQTFVKEGAGLGQIALIRCCNR